MSTFNEDIGMIENIDELVANDSKGAFKKHYLDGVSNFKLQIRRKVDQGLGPQEFEVANKVLEAFGIGEDIFRSLCDMPR